MFSSIPYAPWSVVGMDIFELDGKYYHIIVDYYSNFFEINELRSISSASLITAIRPHFARHGIPEFVLSDNGTQYASAEFKEFSDNWGFRHIFSSPLHPQGNGKAENAVKTVKNLLRKSKAAHTDPLLAILEWRNTPTEGLNSSPAQRLMSRRTRTCLPTTSGLLRPEVPNVDNLNEKEKAKQRKYYNRHAKNLDPLKKGQVVRMRLPGQSVWTLGRCHDQIGQRSYLVEVKGRIYRRNRRDIRATPESAEEEESDGEEIRSTSDSIGEAGVVSPRRLRDRANLRAPDRLTYDKW